MTLQTWRCPKLAQFVDIGALLGWLVHFELWKRDQEINVYELFS